MLGQIFSSIGSAIGGAFGGGILSTIGRFAGRMFGNYLEQLNYEPEEYYSLKNIRDSFNLSKANYGDSIPLIFGSMRVNGKIIWAKQVKQLAKTSATQKYFTNSSKAKALYHNTEYEYFLSFALALCEGEIVELARVWANNELVNLGQYKFRLYLGSEEQLPDPLIMASAIDSKVPAFRGLAYIVFEDLPLADFADSIPNFSFEIIRKANIQNQSNVEDKVKSIVIIPGSGEYVYDTIIQHQLIRSFSGVPIHKKPINCHNHQNIANSIYNLSQLQVTCSHLKWVAPVACWFGDNLDAAVCKIKPAVEFNDSNMEYSEEWRVGIYDRTSAMLISRDAQNNPAYGGSINDATIIRYLEELRKRGLKIMFYPMFFLDIDRKPWRGHLTASPSAIFEFFNKPEGYNNFILHYARLVKNHVDAFVIGSELIGLTKVRSNHNFPAVDELVKLAKAVKSIVGPNVAVTYAADWSEYHHTEGGWHNLDPLWASPDIDFIGIDAYFPITNTTSSIILDTDIIKGWQNGEGYEYYLDAESKRHPLNAEYAWKNLKYWWENEHRNPDGQTTDWRARMKKIWFTEFGFPSVDKATNQPNVFFDPKCFDGGAPRYSSGEVDFAIQRRAIKAFIEYWQQEEYIEQLFLWCWDARPYPAWPHMNVWRDGHLWEKGHWVNNKFGASSVAAIILELSAKCGISLDKIDVSSLDESIAGFVLNQQISAINAINILRISHFFDITNSEEGKINFIKRGVKAPYTLSSEMLIKLSDNSYFEQQDVSKQDIINKLEINFIEYIKEYKNSCCQVDNENFSNKSTVNIKLPIVLSDIEVQRLGKLILRNALTEDKLVKFTIPIHCIHYQPSDIINLHYQNYQYQIRIIEVVISGLQLKITGIFDNFESYHIPLAKKMESLCPYQPPQDIKFIALDLQFIFNKASDQPYLAVYLQSNIKHSLYASLLGDTVENYYRIADLEPSAIIGVLIEFTQTTRPSIIEIDQSSVFIVYCKELTRLDLNNWNLAMCGNEIIKFRNYQQVAENTYRLKDITRGEFATEEFIDTHQIGENFVLVEYGVNIIPVSNKLENKELYLKIAALEQRQNFTFYNKSQKPLPVFIEGYEINGEMLNIKWQARNRIAEEQQNTELYQFMVKIREYNFTTNEYNLTLNFKELDLSGYIDISIIAKNQLGASSTTNTTINL